jgi:hypothetical protein
VDIEIVGLASGIFLRYKWSIQVGVITFRVSPAYRVMPDDNFNGRCAVQEILNQPLLLIV